MTTIRCQHLAVDCTEPFAGADAKEIQQAFLTHVYSKHRLRWFELTQMFRAASLVAVRNRYHAQTAEADNKDARATITPISVVAVQSSPS